MGPDRVFASELVSLLCLSGGQMLPLCGIAQITLAQSKCISHRPHSPSFGYDFLVFGVGSDDTFELQMEWGR